MSTDTTYKSPTHMLIKFFKNSRDNWKSKCMEGKKKIKYFTNKVKFLQASKAKWEAQAKTWKDQAQQLEQKLSTAQTVKQAIKKTYKDSDALAKATNDNSDIVESFAYTDSQAVGQQTKKSYKNIKVPVKITNNNGEIVEHFGNAPARHTYSTDHILLFVSLVLFSATSLRCAANSMDVFFSVLGLSLPVPSWYTGRLWLLRLGYYKLMRQKEIADDWVWIVDYSIQIGTEKCLVILGVRLSNLKSPGPLCHEDLEPIELLPVTKSNGDIVYQQLELTAKKTGVPREIVADRGSDLNAGINKFCEQHEVTCYIGDIKHKSANILKSVLDNDPSWKKFTALATSTKQALQQTVLAHLAPPNQKTKARDMNLDVLVQWGWGILGVLECQSNNQDLQNDQTKIKGKLGWVLDFSESLLEWHEIMRITGKAESFIRCNGIYQGCDIDMENWLAKDASNIESASVIGQRLIEFVRGESLKAHPGERLVGSSEVIESVFGKQKQIEKNQSKSGFTSLVLALAASVSKTTEEVISKAMESTPVKKVIEWGEKYIGESVQSRRKKELGSHQNEKQKWDHILDGK